MYKILIEDIEQSPEKTLHIDFNDKINELEDCEISASIDCKSLGDYIKVVAKVNGKITLECDRCLNKFQHEISFDIDEMFAKHSLYEEYGQEVELQSEQFIIDLNGEKEINIYDLLYQYVILNLPNKKVCGINCNEGLFVSDEEIKVHDERMDIFKNIKIQNNKKS